MHWAAEKEVDDGPECRSVAAHHHGRDPLEWHFSQIGQSGGSSEFPRQKNGHQVKSRGELDFCVSRTLRSWILRQPYPPPRSY